MLIFNKTFVEFSMFRQFHNVVCVVSTRILGNLNVGNLPITNALPLLDKFHINRNEFVSMRQTHSSHIAYVDSSSIAQCMPDTDGLVTQQPNVFLGVNAADCVPVFFYNPQAGIVGVVHAGWRGTLNNIYVMLISEMIRRGARSEDIYAAIGPHIGGCCYSVLPDRAKLFAKTFDSSVVFKQSSSWHLDLGRASIALLQHLGILLDHIDAPITCTSCQNDQFYSYRKNKENGYGEMLGVIGRRM